MGAARDRSLARFGTALGLGAESGWGRGTVQNGNGSYGSSRADALRLDRGKSQSPYIQSERQQ
ncbi:hypothetical protein GCM10009838_07900 [Catenulispora subtropica]|uniref:Uncharacterized protein n=1 Tax=Catenulispora subtropica TaxID=450798 RepID=A0ABP5C1J8_9ACTN